MFCAARIGEFIESTALAGSNRGLNYRVSPNSVNKDNLGCTDSLLIRIFFLSFETNTGILSLAFKSCETQRP